MHTYIQIWNHFFANQRPALSKLQPQHLHCRHPRPRAQFDKSKNRSGGRPKVCRLLGGTFQIAPWAGGVGLRAKKPKVKVSLLFQKKKWAALRAPPRDRVSDSHVQKFSVKENQCHDHRRWTGVQVWVFISKFDIPEFDVNFAPPSISPKKFKVFLPGNAVIFGTLNQSKQEIFF